MWFAILFFLGDCRLEVMDALPDENCARQHFRFARECNYVLGERPRKRRQICQVFIGSLWRGRREQAATASPSHGPSRSSILLARMLLLFFDTNGPFPACSWSVSFRLIVEILKIATLSKFLKHKPCRPSRV